jgi:hypothetical protein
MSKKIVGLAWAQIKHARNPKILAGYVLKFRVTVAPVLLMVKN